MEPQILIDLVQRHLNSVNNLELLDIGCGDGTMLFTLFNDTPNTYKKIKGVDNQKNEHIFHPDGDSLDYAYRCIVDYDRLPELDMFQYEISEGLAYLKNESAKYDLIIFCNVLHFFSTETIIDFLRTSLLRLKPSGYIFLNMVSESRDNSDGYFTTCLSNSLIEMIQSFCDVVERDPKENINWLLLSD